MAFAAGQKLTAALLNAEFNKDRIAYTSGDQSRVSSTVLTNAIGLVLPVEANAWYIYDGLLMYDTNTTADFKWDMTLPTSSFVRNSPWMTSASVAGAVDAPIYHAAYDAGSSDAAGVAAGTIMTIRPTGLIIVSTTSGNMQMRFAQNVSNATATVLKGGSWMRLVKIA